MVEEFDVILSTDRSLMTNHHGCMFLGFGTTMPLILPRRFIQWLFAPPMKHRDGIVWEAPYGIRKCEATLAARGYRVAVVDPDYVIDYLEAGAKVLVLRHHDWFGMNPPTSTWTLFVDAEPLNVVLFREFISRVVEAKSRLNFKIIAAGPAVWQWLHYSDRIDEYMIDVIVDSNGDREDQAIASIVNRILNELPVPRYVKIGVKDEVPVEKMNPIIHASVNGLVEVGRGCPRGCAFCSVGGRPLKWYPYDFIEKEILTNVREGQKTGILSATDILLYGSRNVIPNKEAVIKLNKLAKKHWVRVGWSHLSLAAAVAGGDLLEKLSEMLIDGVKQRIIGVEVGVESGSPRIMEKHMAGKPKPFKCSEWPEIVEKAFSMMHENNIVPASTLVVGLPGEEDEDVLKTVELVERLKPYRSLIVPMFFVPMGPSKLGREEWFRRLRESHIDLLVACLKHDIYWAKKLVKEYLRGASKTPLRIALEWFIGYAEKNIPRIRESLEKIVEERKARAAKSYSYS